MLLATACATERQRVIADGRGQAAGCASEDDVRRQLDSLLIAQECPVPDGLDRAREYCPSLRIEVRADGSVTGADLEGPVELATEEYRSCWSEALRKVRLREICAAVTIRSYSPYCLGWLVAPDDLSLQRRPGRGGAP